jgi:hypothetical protein
VFYLDKVNFVPCFAYNLPTKNMDGDLNQDISRKFDEHNLLLEEKSVAFKKLAEALADNYVCPLTEKQNVDEDSSENK